MKNFSLVHIFLILFCLNLTQAYFDYDCTVQLNDSVNDVSIPPRYMYLQDQILQIAAVTETGDILFYSNGSLIQTNNIENSSIKHVTWMESGKLFMYTDSAIIIYNIGGYSELRLTYDWQNIIFAKCAESSTGYLIAILFTDQRLQILENNISAINISGMSNLQTMTFDETGNYFYYFNSTVRVVYDVKRRRMFNSINFNQLPEVLVSSPRKNYEDITVVLNTRGNMMIFDDYSLLSSYSDYYYKLAAFSDSGELITSDTRSNIHVWNANYSDFSAWTKPQKIQSNFPSSKIQCKNEVLMSYSGKTFSNVSFYTSTYSLVGTILLIIFASIFGCVFLVVGIGILKQQIQRCHQNRCNNCCNNCFNNSGQICCKMCCECICSICFKKKNHNQYREFNEHQHNPHGIN